MRLNPSTFVSSLIILFRLDSIFAHHIMLPTPSKFFILDFDGTVTTQDTIAIIASSAISYQSSQNTGTNFTQKWDDIVAAYTADYDAYVKASKSKEERTTLEDEVSWLRGLIDVEVASFDRVSGSGLFKGINQWTWEDFGGNAVEKGDTMIRTGFEKFLEKVERRWGIVSVNFSRDFIRGVLRGCKEGEGGIVANYADEEGLLRGPGQGEVLATSDGKLAALKKMRDEFGVKEIVYLGDSGTDLECLVAEGIVGVVVSTDKESSLLKTLRRAGVDVRAVEEYEDGWMGVYWAKDFEEIVESPLLTW
ncbi:HAD-like domain-containing protein [Bisporella sp. PMI_857]|nr:HAD-like domain-containing protein [Bisporella sp. PMI_857]